MRKGFVPVMREARVTIRYPDYPSQDEIAIDLASMVAPNWSWTVLAVETADDFLRSDSFVVTVSLAPKSPAEEP